MVGSNDDTVFATALESISRATASRCHGDDHGMTQPVLVAVTATQWARGQDGDPYATAGKRMTLMQKILKCCAGFGFRSETVKVLMHLNEYMKW
ncbi:hypothetical protein CEXT_746691 [Caerostris extrusa]|uniref:Uncharacterized protein n=1 Tax=Caerostris extrusa TaxID=172846 RepID=A0AAV4YBU6_CAEEX|nr:hypothetical protein CEXT_746691 [Caerostris extrusa]